MVYSKEGFLMLNQLRTTFIKPGNFGLDWLYLNFSNFQPQLFLRVDSNL